MAKPVVVVLTGAGISAESGLATFRGNNGLWEGYRIEEVASPEGWRNNRKQVLEFYNLRRKQALEAKPNAAHLGLAALEEKYTIQIITQNVDDLHERAGSTFVLHLHGQLKQARSTLNPELIYDIEGWELNEGQKCELGSQLRPNIVWFGEAVPAIDEAVELVQKADCLLIIGTSLQVYPAAGLVNFLPTEAPLIIVNPKEATLVGSNHRPTFLNMKATEAINLLPELLDSLL